MKYFIFRNMTIERMFSNLESEFSGYEDISYVADADRYIWFYLSPMNPDTLKNANSILGYRDMLNLVLQRIDSSKTFIAFTMQSIYRVNSVSSNREEAESIANYNNYLTEVSKRYSNVKVIDLSSFTNKYSTDDLIDWKYYFISQMAINPRLSKPFQHWFEGQINAIEMKRKKCLVLDLDNTLWGGILGEDGIEGVKLGGDYPGKAFLLFQKQLKELTKEGVMLAVCSKNNLSDVQEMWTKHQDCVLKEENFTICKINWQNKADNMRQMASDLNIGLDSMVFIDDNPTERALVKQEIPEVEVPDFPEQPFELPIFFKRIAETFFAVYSLTKEDVYKTEHYKANALRNCCKEMFTDMNEYIRGLEIKLSIENVSEITIPRAAQMTQKTNQFNLTTKRYTDGDIKRFVNDGAKILTLSVADKFGDNGITGLVIITKNLNVANIDSLLLSCRILGKDIEIAFVSYILSKLKEEGVKIVTARFEPTAKNAQVKEFWEKCGFTLNSESNTGVRDYQINLEEKSIEISKNYTII